MREQTTTAVRYEQMRASLAREKFYMHPESAAEAIAAHYASHATMALQLLELIKMRRCLPKESSSAHADQAIEHLTSIIKRDHYNDFGIALEWQKKSVDN